MIRNAGLILVLALLAGCTKREVLPAADRIPQAKLDEMAENYNASVENAEDEVVCSKERVAGSRFVEVECRTKGRINQDQQAARQYMYRTQVNRQK